MSRLAAADVGQRVRHVAHPGRRVLALEGASEHALEPRDDVEQARAAAAADIVGLARDGRRRRARGEQVGRHDVVDIGEVARLRAVAVDLQRLALDAPEDEARDHRGVLALGVLAGPEHVEVAQADGLDTEEAAPDGGVDLAGDLGGRIGRDGRRGLALALGQVGILAVDRRRGGVDHAGLLLLLGRRVQHVQGAGDIGGIAAQRVGHRARHRAHRRLVEHRGHAAHRPLHRLGVAEVAADDLELLVAAGEGQVVPAARREIIEDPDAVPLVEKALRHVRADEACAAGHKVDR